MLDSYKQTATDIANAANAVWENYADLDGDRVPPNEIDAMQVKLCRWQRRNFGDVSPVDKVDVHMSMGIIEEFGEAISAEEIFGDKGKLDGLGDICVYAGQLLNANRLSIRPIMDLADLIWADWDGSEHAQKDCDPIALVGKFSHVVLKHEQKIRGYDKREVWMPALALHTAALIAYTKLDISHAVMETVVAIETMEMRDKVKDEQMIQRTYLDVGGSVILKRNWTADRIAGQTPA